jgi:hypothetical protein
MFESGGHGSWQTRGSGSDDTTFSQQGPGRAACGVGVPVLIFSRSRADSPERVGKTDHFAPHVLYMSWTGSPSANPCMGGPAPRAHRPQLRGVNLTNLTKTIIPLALGQAWKHRTRPSAMTGGICRLARGACAGPSRGVAPGTLEVPTSEVQVPRVFGKSGKLFLDSCVG